jgi:putative ATP-binding cassette transporter
MIQIIPALIVAPGFMNGEIAFGVVTQSAMAFTTLVGAFSLVVTQYQALSTYAAVIARLSSMMAAFEKPQSITGSVIALVEPERCLAYEAVTLLPTNTGEPLLRDLSISIPFGTRVLVTGPSEAARVALFRATAGVPTAGAGKIYRPAITRYSFFHNGALPAMGQFAPGSRRYNSSG